ncbi:hypothetical protein SAMN04488034_1193 [Salinimicrobium catena]|uniref:Uncharacterized protein n=1 Tax=Salinimicrobium catena TaxID=390640 RepID=A0A1H5PI45_9FLAO|nr:hypothetical protein [Salinimicrobium catena]SDL86509.1 hypothetical protein SAMN04488140_1203 [Salinimicrobium catena]SEF13314.1 hypothetical protein SAMN04488034_1193 [Salinimicrobium catena]
MNNWNILKEEIYFEDGSLRDIYISKTDKTDWESWSKLVNKKYDVEFYDGLTRKKTTQINIERVFDFWNDPDKFSDSNNATINLGNVKVKCYFFTEKEIENDLEPREVKTEKDHLNIIGYLKAIAETLNKDAVLTSENLKENVLLEIKKGSG